jgi:hypothetical protein
MNRFCCLLLLALGAPAWAQQAGSPPQDVEELVVPGRTPGNLRVEIERVETAVYERWNALNGNDDFDVHCRQQAPTGSNIPLRTCAPNFVIQAEAGNASKMMNDARGGISNQYSRAEHQSRMEQLSREMTAEMQRIAREDEQLLRDLARLDELKQLQIADEGKRRRR